MKKYAQLCSILLFFCLLISCKGQIETELPQDSTIQSTQVEINFLDVDPYFVKTDTTNTSYGPSSITRNILQDRKGHIWLASWEGIIRYDGKSFTNFTNTEGLRPYHVFSVQEDSKGNIWFGTIGAGVYRYNGETFSNFTMKEGLANDNIGCFYEDKKGNIWIGTQGGISVFDGNTFRNFTTNEGLTNNDVNSIIEDKTGKIWIGTRGDACLYDGTTFTKFTNKEGLYFANVRSIIEDKTGNIWFGGNDGLWRFDGSSSINLTKDFVGYIYEDKKGNIWTSSESAKAGWALSRYEEKSLSEGKATPTQVWAKGRMLFGILEDTEGGIWFGSLNGVCRYDGESFNCFIETETQE